MHSNSDMALRFITSSIVVMVPRYMSLHFCSCWISSTNAFVGAVYAPMAVSLVYNLTVLLLIGRSLKRHANTLAGSASSRAAAAKLVRAVAILSVLLGCTWSLSILVIVVDRVELQYVFAVANTLQGFCVFLLHTLRSEEARSAWTSVLPSVMPSHKTHFSNPWSSSVSPSRRRASSQGDVQHCASSRLYLQMTAVNPATSSALTIENTGRNA